MKKVLILILIFLSFNYCGLVIEQESNLFSDWCSIFHTTPNKNEPDPILENSPFTRRTRQIKSVEEINQRLERIYEDIKQATNKLEDFDNTVLEAVRANFDFTDSENPIPITGEGYGLYLGLPFSDEIQLLLKNKMDELRKIIPEPNRLYLSNPEDLHITVFALKHFEDSKPQPKEPITAQRIEEFKKITKDTLGKIKTPVEIEFKGLVLTPDGAILVKGFVNTTALAEIRAELKQRVDFAPEGQTSLVHITIGRVLQPLGEDFDRLREKVNIEWNSLYLGKIKFNSIKFALITQGMGVGREVIDEYYLNVNDGK